MNETWKTIGKTVAAAGLPLLGGAIAGPAGALFGRLAASAMGLGDDAQPQDVANAIATNPDNVVRLREIETRHQEVLMKAAYEAETAQIESVNRTMQAEAKSEHWPQYSWRPYTGFVFPTLAVAVYFVLPLAGIPVPVVPETVWASFLAILGVSAFFRGQAKVAEARGEQAPAPVESRYVGSSR